MCNILCSELNLSVVYYFSMNICWAVLAIWHAWLFAPEKLPWRPSANRQDLWWMCVWWTCLGKSPFPVFNLSPAQCLFWQTWVIEVHINLSSCQKVAFAVNTPLLACLHLQDLIMLAARWTKE